MCSSYSVSLNVLNNVFWALIQYLIKANMVDLIVISLLIYNNLLNFFFCFELSSYPWLIFKSRIYYLLEYIAHRVSDYFLIIRFRLNIFNKNTTYGILCTSHVRSRSTQCRLIAILVILNLITWLKWYLSDSTVAKVHFLLCNF